MLVIKISFKYWDESVFGSYIRKNLKILRFLRGKCSVLQPVYIKKKQEEEFNS